MANFDITGKVAIVTGGASGLGYCFVGQLLEKGVKVVVNIISWIKNIDLRQGVTIADISEENGIKVTEEYETKYSKGKILFVKADVSAYEEFESKYFSQEYLKMYHTYIRQYVSVIYIDISQYSQMSSN